MEKPELPELLAVTPTSVNKDEHINLRVSSADKTRIQAKAARAGLNTGEYIRRAALGKQVVEKVPQQVRHQIAAAGNTLQQLTRLATAGRLEGVSIEQLNELITRLLATLR